MINNIRYGGDNSGIDVYVTVFGIYTTQLLTLDLY